MFVASQLGDYLGENAELDHFSYFKLMFTLKSWLD